MPYARVWKSIEYAQHDGGLLFRSGSRDALVDYVGHVRTVKTGVIPRQGISVSRFEDLYGLIIGKIRKAHISPEFDADKGISTVEFNNYEQAVRMFKAKRIDAIAGSGLILNYQLGKQGLLDLLNVDQRLVVGEKEQWLQFSKGSTNSEKIPQLEQAIAELKQQGVFDQIMDEFYGPSPRGVLSTTERPTRPIPHMPPIF